MPTLSQTAEVLYNLTKIHLKKIKNTKIVIAFKYSKYIILKSNLIETFTIPDCTF